MVKTFLFYVWTLCIPFTVDNRPMPQEWWIETQKAAKHFNVDCFFAGGVMTVESRYKLYNHHSLIPPMNLHKDFVRKFQANLYHIPTNIWYGVRALQPMGKEKTETDVLNRYNASCTKAYVNEVFRVKRTAIFNAKKIIKAAIPDFTGEDEHGPNLDKARIR